MFLQETKTKRGGKTYISYLVRESFRTAHGPRGRTICNLTHLPKEVRDMVGRALKGQALVPLDHLAVNNIHSFGGCVVLEDAAARHGVAEWLAPLEPRSAALARAMMFGGLLTAPSVAPFYMEARTARLAMYCGLDPEKERFDAEDLMAALRELEERWPQVRAILLRLPHTESQVVTFYKLWLPGKRPELASLGMDAEGIPIPLMPEEWDGKAGAGPASNTPLPLLALDEEAAAGMEAGRLEKQPHFIELSPASLAALLKRLNPAQWAEALRTGGPVEAWYHGRRYILAPTANPELAENPEAEVSQARVNELGAITAARTGDAAAANRPAGTGALATGIFHGVMTNLPPERLPAAAAMQWALRAREARAAFVPVQVVVGGEESGDGPLKWRNHQLLQFLTHRLRCHLHAEWSALGETRAVEEVLRDLQELHRATLTVDGAVARRLATQPSKAVAELLDRLKLRRLFETADCGRK